MTKEEWNKLSNGEKAWRLGEIIKYMNDESIYYSTWLYFWPDGETYDECMNDFEDDDVYEELEESFKKHYSYEEGHDAGLYSSKEIPLYVIEAAHYWDNELGLAQIKILK